MAGIIGIGVAAGLVSALMTLVIMTGSTLALALFFLAPLPIALAALGWNHKAGLVAAVVGALVLAIAVHPRMAAVYAISNALPAWWFSYVSLLARPPQIAGGQPEWYPVGRVLIWIAGVVAVITALGIMLIATDYDAYVSAFGPAVELVERLNPAIFERVPAELRPQARSEIAAIVAALAPPISAALSVLISSGLLVAAGRLVLASGRLPRPWPHLPGLVLPKRLLIVTAIALAGSFLGGFPGLAARIVFAAAVAAYALQGFATLHALTAGKRGRVAILAAIYAVSVFLGGWPLAAVALVGLTDAILNLRARRGLAPSNA